MNAAQALAMRRELWRSEVERLQREDAEKAPPATTEKADDGNVKQETGSFLFGRHAQDGQGPIIGANDQPAHRCGPVTSR